MASVARGSKILFSDEHHIDRGDRTRHDTKIEKAHREQNNVTIFLYLAKTKQFPYWTLTRLTCPISPYPPSKSGIPSIKSCLLLSKEKSYRDRSHSRALNEGFLMSHLESSLVPKFTKSTIWCYSLQEDVGIIIVTPHLCLRIGCFLFCGRTSFLTVKLIRKDEKYRHSSVIPFSSVSLEPTWVLSINYPPSRNSPGPPQS